MRPCKDINFEFHNKWISAFLSHELFGCNNNRNQWEDHEGPKDSPTLHGRHALCFCSITVLNNGRISSFGSAEYTSKLNGAVLS